MSAGNAKIIVRPDFSGFVLAMERLAAVLDAFTDPLRSTVRSIALAYKLGEVPCGLPHGELDGPCRGCRAVR